MDPLGSFLVTSIVVVYLFKPRNSVDNHACGSDSKLLQGFPLQKKRNTGYIGRTSKAQNTITHGQKNSSPRLTGAVCPSVHPHSHHFGDVQRQEAEKRKTISCEMFFAYGQPFQRPLAPPTRLFPSIGLLVSTSDTACTAGNHISHT